jgi:hypothetical protein
MLKETKKGLLTRAVQYSDAELAARLESVMRASRAIRSEVALAVSESSEMRIASRQLRMDSLRTFQRTAAYRQSLDRAKVQRRQWIAHAIAQVLSSQGFPAFVAEQPHDTASSQ